MRVGSASFSDGAHAGSGRMPGRGIENIAFWWTKILRLRSFSDKVSVFAFEMHCTIHDCISNAEFIQSDQIVYCLLFYRTDHANGIWMDLSEMRYCIDAYVTNLHQNRIPWNDCAKSSYFRSQFACLLCWCPARHQSRNLSRAADEREMKRKCFFLSSIFHIILAKISFCSCGTWAFGYVLVRHL